MEKKLSIQHNFLILAQNGRKALVISQRSTM